MAMRTEVTSTPFATSLREQTGNIIMFTQFKEGNKWTKTCNNAESGDKSDNKSILMSEQDMDAMNSGDESDHDLIFTDMLEDICDRIQTHPNVTRRESRYKLRDHIRQRQLEWKGALKYTIIIRKG